MDMFFTLHPTGQRDTGQAAGGRGATGFATADLGLAEASPGGTGVVESYYTPREPPLKCLRHGLRALKSLKYKYEKSIFRFHKDF